MIWSEVILITENIFSILMKVKWFLESILKCQLDFKSYHKWSKIVHNYEVKSFIFFQLFTFKIYSLRMIRTNSNFKIRISFKYYTIEWRLSISNYRWDMFFMKILRKFSNHRRLWSEIQNTCRIYEFYIRSFQIKKIFREFQLDVIFSYRKKYRICTNWLYWNTLQ